MLMGFTEVSKVQLVLNNSCNHWAVLPLLVALVVLLHTSCCCFLERFLGGGCHTHWAEVMKLVIQLLYKSPEYEQVAGLFCLLF